MSHPFEGAVLLVIDMQRESLPRGFYGVPTMAEVAENCRRVVQAAREYAIPIVYTQHIHRPSGVDAVAGEPRAPDGHTPLAYVGEAAEILPELSPQPQDVVVQKRRYSAFYDTELNSVLHGLEAKELLITGVVTDGCVMTTAWDAFAQDWPVTLIKDGCGASSEGSHASAVLTLANWVYGIQIFRTAEFIKCLAGKEHYAWIAEKPNSVPFTADDMMKRYERL
jgi:biuret amidohydrolase